MYSSPSSAVLTASSRLGTFSIPSPALVVAGVSKSPFRAKTQAE